MTGWSEPSKALPLRWGTYRGRHLAGLALIVSGAICVQGGSAVFGMPLALGTLAHVIGWWIMPAAGWRRIWAVLPSLAITWILLMGPTAVGLLAVPFACWLLVRHRPGVTLLLALPVFMSGVLLLEVFAEYSGMLPALAIMGAVMAACAWAARWAAASRLLLRQPRHETTKIEDVGNRRS